jgi:hypothetical protein
MGGYGRESNATSAFKIEKAVRRKIDIDRRETAVVASADNQATMSTALGRGLLADRSFRGGQQEGFLSQFRRPCT